MRSNEKTPRCGDRMIAATCKGCGSEIILNFEHLFAITEPDAETGKRIIETSCDGCGNEIRLDLNLFLKSEVAALVWDGQAKEAYEIICDVCGASLSLAHPQDAEWTAKDNGWTLEGTKDGETGLDLCKQCQSGQAET